ncbi:hypothetical protein [Bacteroides stercoris]|uniref:hypothetical protein n=1 Tax=Bacteroides stercoris TaxID=46506 RepID=UPI001114643D|nr:hypothetical protein [Bacteroides stercoris]MDC7167393.1 hypothetical protein [Bacteroides stercoris]UWO02530.1 hypothetical protein NQ565_09435 [Bacteroides stercoris ATCC 43183]
MKPISKTENKNRLLYRKITPEDNPTTNGRYENYQPLVLEIPKHGTGATNCWYGSYQTLVQGIPKHGTGSTIPRNIGEQRYV